MCRSYYCKVRDVVDAGNEIKSNFLDSLFLLVLVSLFLLLLLFFFALKKIKSANLFCKNPFYFHLRSTLSQSFISHAQKVCVYIFLYFKVQKCKLNWIKEGIKFHNRITQKYILGSIIHVAYVDMEMKKLFFMNQWIVLITRDLHAEIHCLLLMCRDFE